MNRIDHVIWDWNGTLVDDAQLCVKIVNGILDEMFMPKVSLAFYRDNFCFPVRSYYEKIGLPKDESAYLKVSEKFISEYRRLWRSCKLQENARTVIAGLSDAGISQSILSAGKLSDLTLFVREFGLSGQIDPVTGVSNIQADGKKEISHAHLADVGHDPSNVLLVGDTAHDEEVSIHLGIQCLLFTGGHNSVKALEGCGSELTDDLRQVLVRVLD
jgi:phosphoglycolate phosphatase